ncbi:hypothetical protein KU45_11115 [Salmonella enterica subsp. enterica]|nr:hypothetical protein [Salmonella enterica subsp. enterica]
MARNKKIIVEVDGDTTGLQKKLNQAEDSIGKFGKKAGGTMGSVADNISGGIGRISGGLTGLVGAVGIAGTALAGLTLKANDLVRELNQVSTASGLSVTAIQQWNQAFRETGLAVDKVMDLNQDSLDKLGDAYRNGGSLVDDFVAAGLNIKEFTPLLNQTDGGLKAVIKTFFDLKKAGADQATQTWILETLASDASRLIPILNQSASEQDAWNKIQSQTVAVTEEAARNFKEFDKNLNTLTTTGQTYLIDVLNPVVKSTNDLIEAMNSTNDNFFVNLIDKANEFQAILNKIGMFPGLGFVTDAIRSSLPETDNTSNTPVLNPPSSAFTGKAGVQPNANTGWVDKGKAQAEADKALKAQEAAARKAQAAAQKAAAARETAQRNWETALTNIADNANELRLQNFDRQQLQLQKTIKDTGAILKRSQDEIDAMVDKAKESAAQARTELVDQMIGYSNPNQDLIDQNNLSGLNGTQKGFLADQQNQRINGGNPFAYDNTEKLLQENAQREQLELQLNEKLLAGTEDFEKRKAEIKARYAEQALQLEQQNAQQQLSIMGTAAGDMGTMLAGVFGESSGAAKAAFAIQKAISMSQIMMNLQVALSSALATPFPASLAAYAQVASMGAQIISTAGQFHGGVDSLDPSMDNKSFVLKAGERVVQPEANKKLTQFLDDNASNGGTGETVINAPLIIQGNVDGGDDETFNKMLKKHSQSVNQAVISAQKRST